MGDFLKTNGYSCLLLKQCELLCSGNSESYLSRNIYFDVCQKLEKDFLPPIEREDIASISFVLYRLTFLSDINKTIFKDFGSVIDDLINKKKTCGENIRRLIKTYSDFKFKTNSEESLFFELIKLINEAYFKSL